MPLPAFEYTLADLTAPRLGLVALQSDETIEGDMRRLLPENVDFFVSRVASDVEVTSETLSHMEQHLSAAAGLFPAGAKFDAIGYGCTSGTAQIGPGKIARKIKSSAIAAHVTEPLSSLVAACQHLGLSRIAILSPYVAQVSARLQQTISKEGITTPVFGSFEVSTEATVVRIDANSIEAAAINLMQGADVQGLFLSCTNLRALGSIERLEQKLGKPVLSSNQVLAWHLMQLAAVKAPKSAPGQLFKD
ncbi:MAG: Asp/Glu racemase [Roseobacter sp.]